MTTIAYRDGILAADSLATYGSEAAGDRKVMCRKLYRKKLKTGDVIVAAAGDVSPALLFLDWYGSGKEVPPQLLNLESDFHVLILTKKGLYEADQFCRPELVFEPYYAIGSGAKGAFAAMDLGKSAIEAVRVAMRRDPYTGGRIVWETLEGKCPKKIKPKLKPKA